MKTYEDYCKELAKFGAEPIPEEVWRRSYAPKEEVEILVITPKRDKARVAASLENFIKSAESSKRRKAPKPQAAPKPQKTTSITEKRKATLRLPKTDRVMSPKTCLKSMTEEERKEHKRKQNREWKKKKYPVAEAKPPMTPEEKRAKHRERYHKNKKTPTRIFYKDMTEEQLKAHLKEQRRLQTIRNKGKRKAYAEKNKEKRKEYSKKWNKENKDKRNAINTKYREENREKINERSKEWNEKNPEKRKEFQAKADAKRRKKPQQDSPSLSQTEIKEPRNWSWQQ